MNYRAIVLLGLAALLGGCGWFSKEDEATRPAELTKFPFSVSIDRMWSRGVGETGDELARKLVPALEDGRVFAANKKGRVQALDAARGDRLWSVDTGIRASAGPGVGEGLVVVGGLDGEVVALEAASGEERWRARVTSEVLSVPAVRGNRVVVRSIDGRVFGFDRISGVRQWIYDHTVPLLTLRGTSDPVLRAGAVILGLDNGEVITLNAEDGSVIWEQTVTAPEGRSELERLADIDGHIAVVATEVYAASYQGHLVSLALDSGRPGWEREVSSWQGVAARRTQLFLTDAQGQVWAYDRRNGSSLWRQDALLKRGLSTPAVLGNYVVTGDFEGYIHVLEGETGNLAGRVDAGGGPVDAAPVVSGNIAYVLTRKGDLSAYRIQPRQ